MFAFIFPLLSVEYVAGESAIPFNDPLHSTTSENILSNGKLTATVGITDNDINPTEGRLASWGYTDGIALDYHNVSVGFDLGSAKGIGKIELLNYTSTTRLGLSNYTVYSSNDNLTYVPVKNWTFSSNIVNGKMVHTFTFANLTARYVKVHQNIADTSTYTFVLFNLQTDAKIYDQSILAPQMPATVGGTANDIDPLAGRLVSWGYTDGVALDFGNASVGFDLGSAKGIGKIELLNYTSTTRLGLSNYTVYSSNDNLTYVPVKNWTFSSNIVNGKMVHTFTFANLTARYVKVHQNIADTSTYTFVLFNLQTDAKIYDQSILAPQMSATVGATGNDIDPLAGILVSWGYTDGVAVDYGNVSVGFDLGSAKGIGKIELWNYTSTTRLGQSNYTVYSSNDNLTYVPVKNWTFSSNIVNGKMVHTFTFANLTARYVKVHQNIADTSTYTFVLFNLQTDAKIYDQSILAPQMSATVGATGNDIDPLAGRLVSWGYTDGVAVDYGNVSVGFDLGSTKGIGKIELWNYTSTTRLGQSNYTVYSSNDNLTYVPVKNWTFSSNIVNGKMVHTFTFANLTARYVKVHQNIADTSTYTFVLFNLQTDAKIYDQSVLAPQIPATVGIVEDDTVPATIPVINWGMGNPTATDYNSRSVGFDLGSIKDIGRIELWNNSLTTRLGPSNYTLYTSSDNITYTQTNNWTFSSKIENNQLVHAFTFTNLTTRYVKVHQNIADTSTYTFVLGNLQTSGKVYNPLTTYLYNSRNQPTTVYYYQKGIFYRVDFTYDSNGNQLKKVVTQLKLVE
ncbi:discoidin domain-containing protein [Paenibacillus sp. WQ 127069]|uniref:Discoidin domain-containing protein n=1 Tax=Paenibacillus baimaensis TaxID=2982185 RepID=A0ABT2UG61_9BACL|nr:discoidin domain-containing protein [Paenibacillus sp. WQ 127069]MCU6793628.1 discoidin domain-containing protein [Paenibacillus sp. WQ 127069]